MNMTVEPLNTEVWYRQFWPWFLIAIPLSSVIAGFYMLYLALHTNNSLVVDDYYKQGKEINRRIERDRVAAVLGLAARIHTGSEGIVLQLSSDSAAGAVPESLRLRWVHATQAAKDGGSGLSSLGGNRYLAAGHRLPVTGVWRLHIDDPEDQSWRLISNRVRLTEDSAITVAAATDSQALSGSGLQ